MASTFGPIPKLSWSTSLGLAGSANYREDKRIRKSYQCTVKIVRVFKNLTTGFGASDSLAFTGFWIGVDSTIAKKSSSFFSCGAASGEGPESMWSCGQQVWSCHQYSSDFTLIKVNKYTWVPWILKDWLAMLASFSLYSIAALELYFFWASMVKQLCWWKKAVWKDCIVIWFTVDSKKKWWISYSIGISSQLHASELQPCPLGV